MLFVSCVEYGLRDEELSLSFWMQVSYFEQCEHADLWEIARNKQGGSNVKQSFRHPWIQYDGSAHADPHDKGELPRGLSS